MKKVIVIITTNKTQIFFSPSKALTILQNIIDSAFGAILSTVFDASLGVRETDFLEQEESISTF